MKKVGLVLVFILVGVGSIFFFDRSKVDLKNAIELTSDEIIKLPSKEEGSEGFTCTGLFYDFLTDSFYIGNAGKLHVEDEDFKATIEQVSFDFKDIINSIECYTIFPDMKDIQGVTLDAERNLFFCSYGENLIRSISLNGDEMGEFYIENPSGIAYDSRTDSLWILTNKKLINCMKSGEIIKSYNLKERGQDQLFIDEENNLIYFTCGINYQGENYVYTFDMDTELVQAKYILKDSYAVEGISIIEDKMYILNDGYYHDAKIDVNQVNIYNI